MNNKTKLITTGLACLILGYFVGREHLKYQMRTVMQDTVKKMQAGFGAALGETNDPPQRPTSPAAKTEDQPLVVALLKKDFSPKDIHNGKYEADVTFTIQFSNETKSDIRAFDGILEFTDLLGNSIIASKVEINERVVAGQTLAWDGALEYNQFMDDHQRLRSEPMENLKISFRTHKVLFADGTTTNYE